MSTQSSRVEALFSDALAQPASQRPAFLDHACHGDVALRAQLAALLAAHDGPETLLEPPTVRPFLPPVEQAGSRIGRYKLIEKIGEGGCGVVYLAEQQEPVRRQVALKVIKLGMDTHEVIARFEGERQALALMNHPNIAKVLDAGATDAGRPYFVMELVAGTRITAYCDEHNLSTSARLKLFGQVCQAIQHAHQKGIIHRDIKPSNILVAEHDGVAVPKVIDFGIAKATHGRLTDRTTVLTAFAQFIGTPVYMSPEQAELKGVDIDTRSDIYSLGVLLYEMIAGRPPFDPESLVSAGLDEIRRHIREIEPPRPSTRLSTLGDADREAIARQRGTDGSKLSLLLRGDLDWIVMRCLEKDRARRYETANALALDIQRYLDDQPVSATPPSHAYRFKKLVWRHKFAFATGGAIAALLFAGTIVSTWQAFRAMRAEKLADTRLGSELTARQDAEKQRLLALDGLKSAEASRQEAEAQRKLAEVQRKLAEDRLRSESAAREESERQKSFAEQERKRALIAEKAAQAEAEISRAVNDFLQDDLLRQADSRVQAGSGAAPTADLTMRDALNRAAAGVEGRFGNRPLIESGIRTVIGNTYLGLGDPEKAVSQLERALELRKAELGPEEQGTISLIHQLAVAYRANGRLADAIARDAEVLEISRRRTGGDDPQTLASMTNLANAYLAQGRAFEATPLAEQSLEMSRRMYGAEDPRTLIAINNLAVVHHMSRRYGEAVALYLTVIRTRQKLYGPGHLETVGGMSNLAQSYQAQGQLTAAIAVLTKVVETRKSAQGPEHPDTLSAMSDLAIAQRKAGKFEEALALLDEVIALRRRVLGAEHPETLQALSLRAGTYWASGRIEEAREILTEVAESQSRVLGPEHPDTITTLCDVAAIYRKEGKLDDAATLLRKSVDVRRRALGPRHHDTFRSTRDLGVVYLQQRKFAEAEEMLFTGCYQDLTNAELAAQFGVARDTELIDVTELLAELYTDWGDGPRAHDWHDRVRWLRDGGGLSASYLVNVDRNPAAPNGNDRPRSAQSGIRSNPSSTGTSEYKTPSSTTKSTTTAASTTTPKTGTTTTTTTAPIAAIVPLSTGTVTNIVPTSEPSRARPAQAAGSATGTRGTGNVSGTPSTTRTAPSTPRPTSTGSSSSSSGSTSRTSSAPTSSSTTTSSAAPRTTTSTPTSTTTSTPRPASTPSTSNTTRTTSP